MYRIKNELGFVELFIYDEIDRNGLSARSVVERLKGIVLNGLQIRINSNGGDVFEALAIYNYLKGLEVEKTVYIDGLAASAASVIAMCGDRIFMPANALMMIHEPWGMCQGDSDDMKDTAALLEKVRDSIVSVYASRSHQTPEQITEMMKAETWMNGNEAHEKGFCDYVMGEVKDSVRDAFEAGVRFERERLHELDDICAPGREDVIMKAKYETFSTAKDIAVELLKTSRPYANHRDDYENDSLELWGISSQRVSDDRVADGVKMMNRMRGYE